MVTARPALIDWQLAVTLWHRAFGVPVADHPVLLTQERAQLRYSLIREEFSEWAEAIVAQDLVAQADALADLIYVVVGTAVESGIPLPEVLWEVQRSNMSKLGEDGRPVYREDGKVLKGPGFTPPDITSIILQRAVPMTPAEIAEWHAENGSGNEAAEPRVTTSEPPRAAGRPMWQTTGDHPTEPVMDYNPPEPHARERIERPRTGLLGLWDKFYAGACYGHAVSHGLLDRWGQGS